jgi:hypothetical protein
LQAESDVPVEFEKWVKKLENKCGINIRMGPLDNAKELVAEEMKDLCNACGIQIILMVPYSLS